MSGHEQTTIKINDGISFSVDVGIQDVITKLWEHGITTSNSCIDNCGEIWIEFEDHDSFMLFTQLALYFRGKVNIDHFVRETLWDFFEECNFTIFPIEMCVFDPNEEDIVIGCGKVEYGVSMKFQKENFDKFKQLFFEVF